MRRNQTLEWIFRILLFGIFLTLSATFILLIIDKGNSERAQASLRFEDAISSSAEEMPNDVSIPEAYPLDFGEQLEDASIDPDKTVTFIFGGDVMLSRFVDLQMRKYNDYTAPLAGVASVMQDADITFVNLESPFSEIPSRTDEGATFAADIQSIATLQTAGVDIVSLANNHFGDARRQGMLYTMEQLKKHDIQYTGAGENIYQAYTPTYMKVKDMTVAFLAYSDITQYYSAGETVAGYALSPNEEDLKEHIQEAKTHADIVIVSMHTGKEYIHTPRETQKTFARGAIDAGAHIVVGHHPHVIQPIEYYKDGIIFYSLGNLVFDQSVEDTDEGLLAKVTFIKSGSYHIELIPIVIEKLWKAVHAPQEKVKDILEHTFF